MESSKRLSKVLRRQKVVSLPELRKSLGGCSRVSVFRALKQLDYNSSYSHAGRYYTLGELARFNEDGLWRYGEVGFSKHGTLKETVYHLVENAEAGYRHEELQKLLHVRVHNTLLELVREQRLGRVGREKWYLYVSGNVQQGRAQSRKRQEFSRAARGPASAELLIEILAEVIRGSRICVEVEELTSRISERGVHVTEQQVADVLELYGVKKTLDSR